MSQLYVSDLDGTLLDLQGRLSAYSHSELTRLLQDGLPFTIASARSIVSIKAILRDLPLTLPVIEFNGAFISDLATGRHQFCHALQTEVICSIVAQAHDDGLIPFVSTFNGSDDRLYYTAVDNGGMEWYVQERQRVKDQRLRRVDILDECLREQVVCLNFIGRPERLEPLRVWIQDRFPEQARVNFYDNAYSPGWYWLTVHDWRATKENALRTLAADLQVELADITVFGDAANDIPMFRAAGRSVAVENAEPDVKALADLVIGHHTSDSVARYLASVSRGEPCD